MREWKKWLLERLDLPTMANGRHNRIIEELADHLEEMQGEAMARGLSEEEAEERVKAWLGDPAEAARELARCQPGHVRSRMNQWAEEREEILRGKGGFLVPLADFARDIRTALRGLARKPLFSGVVVLVLALGIGASTAIFTLLDAIILSPLPFDDAGRLVNINHSGQGAGRGNMGQTAAWHFTYEEENRVFEDLGMWGFGTAAVTGVGNPEAVPTLFATAGVFRTLRVNPILGRAFLPEDEDAGAPVVVLLTRGYWQSRFGGDPGVVGRTMDVNGSSVEIAGVIPDAVRGLGVNPSLILPLQFDKSTLFVGNTGFGGVARLREGVALEQASADVARMLPMAFEKFPGGPVIDAMMSVQLAPALQPLKDSVVGSVANLIWVLMAGVAAVLLIACANVANLFLVRAEGKEGEMAVRKAMGAGSRRIGWEYLKESVLLGVMGGTAGLGLAVLGLRFLASAASAQLPRMDEVSLNSQVLLFAVVVSLGSGAFFGMFPVLRQGRKGVVDILKQGGSWGMRTRGRNRTRNVLAVVQMALAVLLLIGSGLMVRTSQALRNVDPGFHGEEDVLALRLTPPPAEVSGTDAIASTHEAVLRRLLEVPGVESVALANSIPMDGTGNVNPLFAEGIGRLDTPPASRRHKWIGEGYFKALQIPVLVGRSFTWEEIHARAPLVMVSEALAREYWGSPEEALGRRVAARPDPPRWYEIIGVVADVREFGLSQDPPVVVYWPQVTTAFWQGNPVDQPNTWRSMSYGIRSSRVGTPGFLQDVREAIWEVNSNMPVRNALPMTELMAQSVARTSFSLALLTIAACVALILGVIGVYGVISYAVSQRTGELGMRIALGAPAGQVKGMILRQGLGLAAIGVTIGLGMSLGLTRLMSGLLFGVSATDPLTFGAVTIALVAVALLATYLPARRAASVDPMTALRAE